MPLFEEEGVYCFANVGRSIPWSVDQMVSADYLKNHLLQRLHISHVDWSWLVDDPYDFGVKGQGAYVSFDISCYMINLLLLSAKFVQKVEELVD